MWVGIRAGKCVDRIRMGKCVDRIRMGKCVDGNKDGQYGLGKQGPRTPNEGVWIGRGRVGNWIGHSM